MSHVNRSYYKSEVKSKIGDYIRGKISAQSLMHPSRVNTKPIDKRKYNLHSGIQCETTRTDYQKKVRRPPLKDYIEGKVKLCDMISPSKITYIPRERKYQNLLPPCDGAARLVDHPQHRQPHHHQQLYESSRQRASFAESVETVNSSRAMSGGGAGSGYGYKYPKNEWSMSSAKYHPPSSRTTSNAISQYSLVPMRTAGCAGPSTGKRKLMCKIKVQQNGNARTGAQAKCEEHIIEIPERMIRRGHGLPKFLMDRYNIPCYVNGSGGGAGAGCGPSGRRAATARRQQLSILDGTSRPQTVTVESYESPPAQPPLPQSSSSLSSSSLMRTATTMPAAAAAHAIEYSVAAAEGENSAGRVDDAKDGSDAHGDVDVDNLPLEQGDYNNATTYVFEFYEEEVPHETKSAIIEEVEDDHSNRGYAKSYAEDARFNRNVFDDSLRSDEFQHYEDFKSNIYVQRELMDLHRGMLKCDKNFMVVEHNVNQVTASLNMLESVQNQEIKPSVEKMKHQLQTLLAENEELKKSLQYLRKKTTDYDKVIYYIRQDSNMKLQELENKLETLTQTQVKSIEMQNTVNKNIIQITHGMKRVYNEQDSKHCCNSIKSPKNSNLTIS